MTVKMKVLKKEGRIVEKMEFGKSCEERRFRFGSDLEDKVNGGHSPKPSHLSYGRQLLWLHYVQYSERLHRSPYDRWLLLL